MNRIIVVAGMHRGGTSAAAAALHSLGVEFGSNLMPATGDNEKGYWEDLEIKRLNVELLHRLGSAWYVPGVPSPGRFAGSEFAPFRLRAVRLLRKHLAGSRPFGIKDPRMARLLPFWRNAIATAGAVPSFLIALRHPQSVAQSLARRDGLERQLSYDLWLEHMTAAEMDSRGFDRVVVDFDLLVGDAPAQTKRIARLLNLALDATSPTLRNPFIDPELVRSNPDGPDAPPAESVPMEVQAMYARLASLARTDLPDQEAARGCSDGSAWVGDSALALRVRVAARVGAARGALHARIELLKGSSGPLARVLPIVRAARRIFGRKDFNDDVRRVNPPRIRTG